jgi:exopolyphosphatase/guanosine-5'-triphosphate,3'-diphosphate pyrophosphatase
VTACVAEYVKQARGHGARGVEVLVTSPGRQATNGDELVTRLERATHVPVRLLSAVDEARLGFAGGVAATRIPPGRSVAVVDVGGGSAQIAVGTRRDGPTWMRSIDIGSIRLTSR